MIVRQSDRSRTLGSFGWWPTTWVRWAVVVPVAVEALLTMCRWFGIEFGPLAWVIALTPYVALASVAVLAFSIAARSTVFIAIAAVSFGLQASWLLPLYIPSDPGPSGGQVLTVMTSNIAKGRGDPATIVNLVSSNNVDLLAVEELTPEAAQQLQDAGIGTQLAYQYLKPSPGFTGTGMWSRYPVTNTRAVPESVSVTLIAEVAAPVAVTFVATHPIAPSLRNTEGWEKQQALLQSSLATIGGPVFVAGDFNATLDHQSMRSLEADGFVDAARQAGAGVTRTFPVGHGFPFPLFALDHILARDPSRVASQVETETIPGSDHRAVVARYVDKS